MTKAFITLVVDGANCSEIVEALEDARIGEVVVLTQGDIRESAKELDKLPNEVWLYLEQGEHKPLILVQDDNMPEGRYLDDDEVEALRTYGVCTELKIVDHRSARHGPKPYVVHTEAAQAEVCELGFDVAERMTFKLNAPAVPFGADDLEQRWLRIAVPAFITLKV